MYVTSASAARYAESVAVNTIGVSISPSSSICVAPISLPDPLPTASAAARLVRAAFGDRCGAAQLAGPVADCKRPRQTRPFRGQRCGHDRGPPAADVVVRHGRVTDASDRDVGDRVAIARLETADGQAQRAYS